MWLCEPFDVAADDDIWFDAFYCTECAIQSAFHDLLVYPHGYDSKPSPLPQIVMRDFGDSEIETPQTVFHTPQDRPFVFE